MRSIFRFPDMVNETSARLVAAGVVAQGIAFLLVQHWLLLVPLVYGFLARVLSGPSLSPLGQFVTRVATPTAEALTGRTGRMVPGAPKRFAQMIGLVFTSSALLTWSMGASLVAMVLMTGLVLAAGLEAAAGICCGCLVYNAVWGCPECADINLRRTVAHHQAPERTLV